MDIYDIMNMNDDEYTDYMIEEYKKKPTNKEIIKNSGKTAGELVRKINSYDTELLNLVNKYEIPMKNKVAFILKLVNLKGNIEEIMPLVVCFICRDDYIFEIKSKKISEKNYAKLAEYVLLKENIQRFEKYYADINLNGIKYDNFLKKIKVENKQPGMVTHTKEVLMKLFKEYISPKEPLVENIEHIHNFAMGSNERQNLYPLIIFQAFTKYKSKIPKQSFLLNAKNIMNYKNYTAAEKDNGKNFKTYGKYVSLFLELINNFSVICDEKMCMYCFEKSSNLAKWMFKNNLYTDIFHHTVYSLIQSTYKSIFFEESIFWEIGDLDFHEYIQLNEIDSRGGDHLMSKIKNKLSEDSFKIEEYLNEYSTGNKYSEIYVKNLTDNIFEIDKYRDKSEDMEIYLYLTVEGQLQERGDDFIKEKIIELLD